MQIRRYAWVVAMAMISMLATYVAIYVVHVWVPKLPTAGGLIIFLGTGLLAEEFWFRGAILLLAEKACSRHQHRWAILLSAACYGLSHWQYHGFALTTAAAMQIAYTFLLGLLLGLLRRQTQSLWPAVGLHLAVNMVAVMAVG